MILNKKKNTESWNIDFLPLIGILIIGVYILSSFAADYTWDVSTSPQTQTGNGIWGTDNFWAATASNGKTLEVWPGAGNSAKFGAADGTYTITVNGIQAVDSITFLYSGYTLSGGTLNLGTKQEMFVAAGKTGIINSVISGTNGMRLYGSGTLILTGNNNYTGNTTISGGTLQVGNGGVTGIVPGDIVDNAGLVFNRSDSYTYSNSISGSGTVTQAGNGTLVLSGNNTYSGVTTVSTGTLMITGSTDPLSVFTVGSGATLAGTGTVNGAVNASNGTISPGNNGAGTLSTGALSLNSSSVLNFELGASRDSLIVTDLTLDGVLNITGLAGYGDGYYTLIKYSGSLIADNGLTIGAVPSGYTYNISANAGAVILSITQQVCFNQVTVVQAAPRCSVYTNDWTLVFNNGAGGGITTLTDAAHGGSSGQGNQIGASQTLYYFAYGGSNSKINGNGIWSVLSANSFYAVIRQSGTIAGFPYVTDYTVHGSGKLYIKTTLHNNTASGVSTQTVRCVTERRAVATMAALKGDDAANLCTYLLLSSDSSKQNDILLSIKDLWNTSYGAPGSATGFYTTAASGYAGYENNNFSLGAGQRQSWEFMLDFVHNSWNDTTGVGKFSDDYRSSDSLEFLAGTPLMENAWEKHLQGHWKLDDSTGDTARDNSGNNRHAKSTSTSWTTGRWSGGLSLNGSQNITYADNSDFDGTDLFTVMAWIKINNGALTGSAVVISKYSGASGWKLTGNGSDQLVLYCDASTITGTRDVGDGNWHHVAASFHRDTVKLYVDGILDKVSAGPYTVTDNAATLVIGNGCNGVLDDVRYYHDYISENTLKAICQQGFRSSEGMYELRADNNNTLHIKISGGAVNRCFPVFQIHNYWASSKPAAGCVVYNGASLTENTDYFADFDNTYNTLTLGLNKIVTTDAIPLYIDNDFTNGFQLTGAAKEMSWGVQNNGSYDYFWVKNFSGSSFGSNTSNQFYLNWKMSTAANSKGGEPWFFAHSVTNPNTAVDTATNTNLIPGYDGNYDDWGYVCLNINSNWPKSCNNTINAFSYAVEESSSVRVLLRINQRIIKAGTDSFNIVTHWAIYPTGQIFRYDSLYSFSTASTGFYAGAFLDDSTYSTSYSNKQKKRAGLIYTQSYPDFGYAWLGLRNSSGYQSQPFDSDTILPNRNQFRAGMDFGDNFLPALWNSTSIQITTYRDIQRYNMSTGFIDSVSNSVQYRGTGGGAVLFVSKGALVTNTTGDLDNDGFNEREGAYVVSASENTVNLKLPARTDTCRFYPAFRITQYYAAEKPAYVFLYNSSGDTIPALDGYQYNAYLNRTQHELIMQIDSVFCDSVGIFISRDKTLAVEMSRFGANGGSGCDTIGWRTESEMENLGFNIYRRIKPDFYDDVLSAKNSSREDSLYKIAITMKQKSINTNDTLWKLVNKDIIPGAPSGASYGPRNYKYLDFDVINSIVYEYKLIAFDYSNQTKEYGPVEVMPQSQIMRQFRLIPNYPNPFRGLTVIGFELPVETRVTLNIYNLQGRLVRKLITPDKKLTAQYHQVAWNGKSDRNQALGSGSYIYKLITGGFVKTRIMIMLK